MPCVVQMLFKLSSERTKGAVDQKALQVSGVTDRGGILRGLAPELDSSRHFVPDRLHRIERLGLVRRTMVRALVTRERPVPTDDPA